VPVLIVVLHQVQIQFSQQSHQQAVVEVLHINKITLDLTVVLVEVVHTQELVVVVILLQ
tara:strand:+ start:195 stop:371 length:177 start_codon:yes stop_codon:yes gene_type:complete